MQIPEAVKCLFKGRRWEEALGLTVGSQPLVGQAETARWAYSAGCGI